MTHQLSAAQQVLGGYFHQDWTDEFADADEAIAAIVDGETVEQRRAAAGELRALAAAEPDDAILRRILVDQVGCYYEPGSDGQSDRAWLASVADRISA